MSPFEIEAFLTTYKLPFIFLGSFFFGETVIITAAFLSVKMGWSPVIVFLLALAGTACSDSMWFFIGRYFSEAVSRNRFFKNKYPKKRGMLAQIIVNPRNTLLYYKFMYGFRILTIFYISARDMSYAEFAWYNTFGAVVWLVLIIGVGWCAGMGIINIMPYMHSSEYYVLILIILLIAMRLLAQWIGKILTKE